LAQAISVSLSANAVAARMTPRVSIIMPAYNAGDFIGESINSALSQTFADWELVVVEDGSTDGTAEVVEEFACRDKRIKLLRQANGGQAHARNSGLNQARGSLIAFLDADDLWVPEKLELQIAVIEREEVDLVFSCGWMFRDGEISRTQRSFPTICGSFAGDEFMRSMLVSNRIPIPSVLVRRDVVNGIGGFNEDLRFKSSEDYELWLRLVKHGATFYGMSEPLFYYRQHNKSATSQTVKWHQAMIATIQEHRDCACFDEPIRCETLLKLYRGLTLGLIASGETDEARRCLEEMAKIKRLEGRFYLLSILMKILPDQSQIFYKNWLALKRRLGLLSS
jgi:GT2 family glycosyltransferase